MVKKSKCLQLFIKLLMMVFGCVLGVAPMTEDGLKKANNPFIWLCIRCSSYDRRWFEES